MRIDSNHPTNLCDYFWFKQHTCSVYCKYITHRQQQYNTVPAPHSPSLYSSLGQRNSTDKSALITKDEFLSLPLLPLSVSLNIFLFFCSFVTIFPVASWDLRSHKDKSTNRTLECPAAVETLVICPLYKSWQALLQRLFFFDFLYFF